MDTVLRLIIIVTLTLGFIALNALVLIWGERKVAARFQRRVGPEVVGGPFGILQSLADGIKLFSKEDVMPRAADRWVWSLAPAVAFLPAMLLFLVVPFGFGDGPIADMNVAVVFVAAVSSYSVMAIFMAGWGSNNKYSLLGAMRSVAQMISYEIPLVLSLVGVVLLAGSLSLADIVDAQTGLWYIVPQFLGFIIFLVASLAELNRIPFDLSVGESELVAGYLTEYSGIRWAMFMFAEYTSMFLTGALATALFLGGWHGPEFLPGWIWFGLKSYFVVFLMMWIRWTLPRVRIDQLMDLGWKFMIPVSLLNILVTGVILVVS